MKKCILKNNRGILVFNFSCIFGHSCGLIEQPYTTLKKINLYRGTPNKESIKTLKTHRTYFNKNFNKTYEE